MRYSYLSDFTSCSVGIFHGFIDGHYLPTSFIRKFNIATFMNNELNKKAFLAICKKHNIVYQSPIFISSYSKQRTFLVVFEKKGKR